jgi:hypothetical protein
MRSTWLFHRLHGFLVHILAAITDLLDEVRSKDRRENKAENQRVFQRRLSLLAIPIYFCLLKHLLLLKSDLSTALAREVQEYGGCDDDQNDR